MEKTKWTKAEITALIDAYRNETCLYSVKNPNYHNKRIRSSALQRVCKAVRVLRPETDVKECQNKFYNLRNQFNVENCKRKASLKSSAGVDDVYIPSLWYFDNLLFLEEYVVPRKTPKGCRPTSTIEQETDSTHNSSHGFSDVGHVMFSEENGDEENCDQASQLEITYITSSPNPSIVPLQASGSATNQRLEHPSSPLLPPSDIRTDGPSPPPRPPKRKRTRSEDPSASYMEAVESIAKSLREHNRQTVPEGRPLCPVDACMQFLGSILKDFRSEELQLEVMNNLVQMVINAKTVDMLRKHRKD